MSQQTQYIFTVSGFRHSMTPTRIVILMCWSLSLAIGKGIAVFHFILSLNDNEPACTYKTRNFYTQVNVIKIKPCAHHT